MQIPANCIHLNILIVICSFDSTAKIRNMRLDIIQIALHHIVSYDMELYAVSSGRRRSATNVLSYNAVLQVKTRINLINIFASTTKTKQIRGFL